jgi:NAD+ synthase (glutamine-hydrolysing)
VVADADTAAALRKILALPSSPELVPGPSVAGRGTDAPHQSTEGQIGPYDLHDFFLYYATRRGYSPGKIAYLAAHAWANDVGSRNADSPYSLETVMRWLEVFVRKFFETSQFKRSCIPNGPKVGSGGSLSPRGDWRAPSDAKAAAWLADLAEARERAKSAPRKRS